MHSCFDLVFACFCFAFFFTSGYSHFSSTGIESGARLALEARHKHVQHSTQVQAQSASILWAVLHIPPSTGYFFRVILIAHRSDSWSPEVYYTLLHTVALGQTRFRAAFFTLLCQFSRLPLPSLARNHANFEHSSVEEFLLHRLLLKTFPETTTTQFCCIT